MKIIGKLISSILIGGIILVLINLIGGFFGFGIPLNLISAFVVGFLGIPGLVTLVILKYVFLV